MPATDFHYVLFTVGESDSLNHLNGYNEQEYNQAGKGVTSEYFIDYHTDFQKFS